MLTYVICWYMMLLIGSYNIMKEDFIEFNRYYRQAIEQIPDNSFYHWSINHKYRHAVCVLREGRDILNHSDELADCSEKFRTYAEHALLFHDVGRFTEWAERYKAEQQNLNVKAASDFYDHCLIGYNLMKNKPIYGDWRILFAIRYHGKMMQDVKATEDWQKIQQMPSKDDIIKILYLVRDADKLANLSVIKSDNHLTQDVFYRQLTEQTLYAPISESVMAQFAAGQTIRFPTVKSFADRVLMVISWIYDFNYSHTKRMFKQKGYDKFLFELLRQYHSGEAELAQIKQALRI